MKIRLFLASVATALGLGLVALTPIPASAELRCPITSPNISNGSVCAEADYVTGQGYIAIKGAITAQIPTLKLEMQSKIGTQPWQTRCTVYNKSQACSGISGFATPTNTKVRAKLWFSTTSYGYYDVPIGQV